MHVLPIRNNYDYECNIAEEIYNISDWIIKNFGSSDCNCPSHLFGMNENPIEKKDFIKILLHFRMGKLMS